MSTRVVSFVSGLVLSCFAASAQVPNDACADATLLACNSSGVFSNEGATTDIFPEPNIACSFGGPDAGLASVWFKFVAISNSVTVSLCPQITTGADSIMGLFTFDDPENPCGSLREIACNDDFCSFMSRLQYNALTPGRTYYIKVAGWNGAGSLFGSFNLSITCPPPTGACCLVGTNCVVTTQANCASMSGTYAGDFTDCGGPRYVVSTIADTMEDIRSTGTVAVFTPNSDDGRLFNVPLGFSFPFYGNNFTLVHIYSNGLIAFDQTNRALAVNESLPSSLAPNNIIAALWDDLFPGDPNAAGPSDVRYESRTSPNRFIVQWTNVPQFGFGDSNTFQIILFANGTIDFRYADISPQAFTADYTVGLENATATEVVFIDPATLGSGGTTRRINIVTPPNPCPLGCAQPGCDGPVDADFDADCDVDLTDLAILLSNFGTPTGMTNATGDTDSDGDADLTDLANLLARFGNNCL